MATIHEYRQRIDHRLSYLEMEATALEDDLTHTHEQVLQKYETLIMSLRNSLVTVKRKFKEYKQLSTQQRNLLLDKIDRIQVHLTHAQAETEQGIRDKRQQIMTELRELEQHIDSCFKQKSTELTETMLQAIDKLNAEFAALEIFFSLQSKRAMESFLNNREKLVNQLHEFNHNLLEKYNSGARKSLQIERELSKGLNTIKSAFLHLKD
ncbi:hypothetical protein BN59_00312 [Legionella massiliensis]|uniref:Uncharacterized protein n=1 Tax=Legionella massiliensis TaxID=1034943 RepID=A0A078KWH8_9GAMM|nr:hypothetical protein [Legionella massiliensis]CDZ76048.1 hypothetical protein BN59_00312 [Legionella massiliensis]CEE11786.1 hypothetical protein BN1094_00312 [Legionella massiliensis]